MHRSVVFKFARCGESLKMTVESPAFVQVLLLMPLSQLAGTVHDCRVRSLSEKILIAIRDEEYLRKSGAPL